MFKADWVEPGSTPPLKPGGLLLAGLVFLCGSLAYQALFIVVGGFPVYVWLGVTAAIGLLGIAYYLFRDIRKWRSLAVLQVLLGCAGGTGVVLTTGGLPTSLSGIISAGIGSAGAVITVANGVEKLRKLRKEHEGREA